MTSFKLTEQFDAISSMFRTAISKGKRYPKVTLETVTGRRVVLSLAGAKSRTPGAIQVTDGGRYGENTWYGRIETNGQWVGGRDCTDDVADLLVRFGNDPLAVARSYGLTTGTCCFCQRHLSDSRSVLQGYGPICAANHGLEWGSRPEVVLKESEVFDRSDAEWDELYQERVADFDGPMAYADSRVESYVEPAFSCWTQWI